MANYTLKTFRDFDEKETVEEVKPYTLKTFDQLETVEEAKPYTLKTFDQLEDSVTAEPTDKATATRQTLQLLPDAQTINDLMTDNNFAVVGQYMDQRFGMQEARHGRQKIVDSFVNHMRKFNFGQSVTTGTELAYLSTDDETKKIAAGQAYKLLIT